MRVKNVQTLAGNEAFRIKETNYVVDYLSRPNNDLMSLEKGGVTTRATYGRGYELLGQKVMPGAESTTPAQMMHFQSDIWGSPLFAVGEQEELLHYAERNIWGDLKIGVHGNSDLAGFYDSSQGRMLAKDPIKRGLNPYLYCDNDPVDYVDSTGEIPTMLIGGLLGGVTGGVFGFAGSAVSQLVSGEEFSWKKALGSAANGAVVGAVQGSLVGSGVGIPAAFAANFGAGAVGNALEQKISTGRVDVRESITSGLTNAVSGAIYGNAPLKSFKSAFFRGSAAGGATAAINNISNALGIRNAVYADVAETDYSGRVALGWTVSNGRRRNPRTLCGGSNPFEKSLGYQTAYGYQYSAGHSSSSTRRTRKKKGFSLGEFAKDVAVGTMTGGLASVAFHGLGKAVEALTGSVQKSSVRSKTGNSSMDFQAANREFTESGMKIATIKEVRKYKKDMRNQGIKVIVDKKEKRLPDGMAAGFDYVTGEVVIRKKPTLLSLQHEGFHAKQWLEIGQEEYMEIGRLAREEYVYKNLVESNILNEAELAHSEWYILKVRRMERGW